LARYTVDANVVVNRLLPRGALAAQAFFDDLSALDELYAAQVLLPECTSVLHVQVFEGRVTRDEGQLLLAAMLQIPFSLVDSSQQFARAFELADRFQHRKGYDLQYVAVAEMTRSTLVTGDRGSIHAAREIGVQVRIIR
jgi:predicted nucleic acid-binding protein